MFQFSRKKLKFLLFSGLIFSLSIAFFKLWSSSKVPNEIESKFEKFEVFNEHLGENGSAVYLTDPEEIKANEKMYWQTGLNVIVSNKISVNRSIPDTRPLECRSLKYSLTDPKVSIIIIFAVFSTELVENFSFYAVKFSIAYVRKWRDFVLQHLNCVRLSIEDWECLMI